MSTGADVTKDDLVVEIGSHLGRSSDLPDNWRSLAMVFSFGDGGRYPSSFGYAYTGAGAEDWEAISSTSDDLDDAIVALRDAIAADSGHAFDQVLFRLVRESAELTFDFAYDAPRWKVTPATFKAVIAELRPEG